MLDYLSNPNIPDEAKYHFISAVGLIKPPDAVKALLPFLKSKDTNFRLLVLEALGRILDKLERIEEFTPDVISAIYPLRNDINENVRDMAFFVTSKLDITLDILEEMILYDIKTDTNSTRKCTCGSASIGGGSHSSWCDINKGG